MGLWEKVHLSLLNEAKSLLPYWLQYIDMNTAVCHSSLHIQLGQSSVYNHGMQGLLKQERKQTEAMATNRKIIRKHFAGKSCSETKEIKV